MEPQSGGEWEREHRGLCQCLVSTDIDTYRLGKNCAEGAQTSRTPMSSCQDYASRRPQEPWKYLDIFFAPPLVCSATQCIIFCGRETRFQVARDRTLKGRACIFFIFFIFIVRLHFSHSAGAICNHITTPDSSSLIPHPCHVVYHCLSADSCPVICNSLARPL